MHLIKRMDPPSNAYPSLPVNTSDSEGDVAPISEGADTSFPPPLNIN